MLTLMLDYERDEWETQMDLRNTWKYGEYTYAQYLKASIDMDIELGFDKFEGHVI